MPLVLWLDGRIESDGFIPEKPEHLHADVVVPDTGTYNTLRTRHAAHFRDCFVWIRNEVHDEQGQSVIECCILELQRLGIADFKVRAVRRDVLLCIGDESLRRIHTSNLARRHARFHRPSERSGSGTYIEDPVAVLDTGER